MVNMSELKVYRDPKDGLAYREFYEKSEVDKVIAEKDKKIEELKEHIDELQKATDSAWSKVNVYYDELSHSKYKRCLAMAKMCDSEENRLEAISPIFDTDNEYWEYNSDYWARWHDCWLELAEEPTWEKFLQLIHMETDK